MLAAPIGSGVGNRNPLRRSAPVPRWSVVIALAAFLTTAAAGGAATPASAYTYGDTLTVIWKPLPNLPAFARPGDTHPPMHAFSSSGGFNPATPRAWRTSTR
jgi:hypothetical protein